MNRATPVPILLVLVLAGCDQSSPRPLTPLQRVRQVRESLPAPPAVPDSPEKPSSATGKRRSAKTICPLPGEDPARCPKTGNKPSQSVTAAHVLVGWRGTLPGPGPDRAQSEAEILATEILHKARRHGANFMSLVHQYSDDRGRGAHLINKRTRHRFVRPFIEAAQRLEVGQVTLTRSRFGYHVVQRMADDFEAPPRPLDIVVPGPCPLAGELLERCPRPPVKSPSQVVVEHILIGYKGALARRRATRSETTARKLAIELTHKARQANMNFKALRVTHSDDPGDGTYTVTPQSVLEPAFQRRALSLSPGNVAAVHSRFGYHVLLRRQ